MIEFHCCNCNKGFYINDPEKGFPHQCPWCGTGYPIYQRKIEEMIEKRFMGKIGDTVEGSNGKYVVLANYPSTKRIAIAPLNQEGNCYIFKDIHTGEKLNVTVLDRDKLNQHVGIKEEFAFEITYQDKITTITIKAIDQMEAFKEIIQEISRTHHYPPINIKLINHD
jgi:hypothetical protein